MINSEAINPKKCGFWKPHEWGKWRVIQDGALKYEGKIIGTMAIQQRECLNCGFIERNKQQVTSHDQ